MAVTWEWKNKIGYYITKDVIDEKLWKVDLYSGNCLGVEIWHYPDNDNQYIFQGFWNDEKHLENMLGLNKQFKDNMYKNVTEIHLYSTYSKCWNIAKRFAKVGIKVIIEKNIDKGDK